MLKKISITLAAVVFICITLLFLDFTGGLRHYLGWMAKIQFLPAVLALNFAVILGLIILTLLFGRIYCSIICPLGVFQDIMARIGRWGKRNPYSYSPAKSILRYGVLAVFILALVCGVGSFVALLAPYSAYGRIASNLFQPIYLLGNNALAAIAAHINSYAFYSADIWLKSMPTFIVAVATLIILVVLAWRNGRSYCNTICPVGTFLSLFARFSWMKIHINEDECHNCGKCSRYCKAACIDFKEHKIDYSRCVVCGDCLGQCSFNALHYCHPAHRHPVPSSRQATAPTKAQFSSGEQATQVDTGRRNLLLGIAMTSTAVAKAQKDKKIEGGLAKIEDKVAPERTTPITPPGSYSAEHMAQHCTGCQLCVSECPNGVLRPSAGLMTLMQPVMSYERGWCRPECTRCSEVCPTGAIKLIKREDKSSIHVGHAVWIKKNCVVLRDGVECGNCSRHCPNGAIDMVPYQTPDGEVKVPAVDPERCIGCGACENLCPARPFSAIYVEGHEVHKVK